MVSQSQCMSTFPTHKIQLDKIAAKAAAFYFELKSSNNILTKNDDTFVK